MSFETWYEQTYPGGYSIEPKKMMEMAFNAGRIESKAEIAVLQSERDVLREAIKIALSYGTFDFQKFEALLSTPASGEPARKL